MKTRTFIITLSILLIVCFLATLLHAIYVADAYNTSSIIYFIANELW